MHHDNDNAPRSHQSGATPLGTRLARARREDDLRRYIKHGTVVAVPTWLSAESNLPEAGKNSHEADRVTEMRPSPDEMVRLAARDAANARAEIGPFAPAELAAATTSRIRRDARGQITEWRGSDGKWRPTAELFRQPKGQRRKTEKERQDENWGHLSILVSGGFSDLSIESSTTPSEGEDYRRLRATYWVQAFSVANDNRRQEIDRLGVGSRHTFEQAWENAGLPPACRLPRFRTVIAKGAEFMAFRVNSNPKAKPGGVEGGHDLVERQLIETIDSPRIDAALGEHAKVLDLSMAGLTAKEIAAKLGWGTTKSAERRAVAAQDAALAALAGVEVKLAA